MKYRKDWDLRSIPLAAIPDDLLNSWRAQRNSALRKKKETTDPAEREHLDKKAASMRQLRASRKLAELRASKGIKRKI